MKDFKVAIDWIARAREKGISWEEIQLGRRTSEEELRQFLLSREKDDFWPEITVQQWYSIVDGERKKEDARKELIDSKGATVIRSCNEANTFQIPSGDDSAWQTYKRHIERVYGMETAALMEDTTLKTLRSLSTDTASTGAIRGMVVGNVQSGKTANMGALMAMAADLGWNMFVVLSGMMENLRIQTRDRLLRDLAGSELTWTLIDHPSAGAEYGSKLKDLNLRDNSNNRYLTVCLKNSSRLRALSDWLKRDQNPRENLRILVIDDECDQASINTATPQERTKINSSIVNLINNRFERRGGSIQELTPFRAINYIGYTATPFANVLNEVEGLYPKDFILSLPVSDSYFGPQQIFGYEGGENTENPVFPGLDIVRNIPGEEKDTIEEIHENGVAELPNSLKDALCWFVCATAYMRFIKYGKPVSMLIHTSYQKDHHTNLDKSISQWFANTSRDMLINRCRTLWETECKRFSPERFHEQLPAYPGWENFSYPGFGELSPYIDELLKSGVSRIEIDRNEGNRIYTSGIHMCIDNSERNMDEGTEKRLFYPDTNDTTDTATAAFIVVGGNTLSRGLTLEGLVSTYFIRPGRAADSLMQMGRWFGYRRRYELIPRIWMPQDTREKFEFISEMDQCLRDEIREMAQTGISPSQYGPKVLASPSAHWLRVVSANRMQGAVATDFDFTGRSKETGVFDNKKKTLEKNMQTTRKFLGSLGEPSGVKNNPYASRNVIWRGVSPEKIREYLNSYIPSRNQRDGDMEPFMKWMDKNQSQEGAFGNWNVILAGIASEENGRWELSPGNAVNKVSRTQRTPDRTDGVLNIGVLRSFTDFVSDIDISDNDRTTLKRIQGVKPTLADLNQLREEMNLSGTPLLVIYIIDKDSRPGEKAVKRFPLNAVADIAAYSIYIPGIRNGNRPNTAWQLGIEPTEQFDN